MKRIWEAIVDWIVRALSPEIPEPPKELKPGCCMCSHMRCSHAEGEGRCHGQFAPCEDHKEWRSCACVFYIEDEDDDDGGDDEPEHTPSPEELEKMFR